MKVVIFVINVVKKFNPNGILQNESESKQIDTLLMDLLENHSIKYHTFKGNRETCITVANMIKG